MIHYGMITPNTTFIKADQARCAQTDKSFFIVAGNFINVHPRPPAVRYLRDKSMVKLW